MLMQMTAAAAVTVQAAMTLMMNLFPMAFVWVLVRKRMHNQLQMAAAAVFLGMLMQVMNPSPTVFELVQAIPKFRQKRS